MRRYNFFCCFTIVFSAFFCIVIFNVYDVFFHNAGEFEYRFNDFGPQILIFVFILSLILSIFYVLLLYKKAFFRILLYFISGVTLAAYLQLSFLNGNLPSLDGTSVDWTFFNADSMLSLFVWLLSIGISVAIGCCMYNKHKKFFLFPSAFVLTMCIVSITISAFSADRSVFTRSSRTYRYSGENQMHLGKDGNTIVMIVDTLDNTSFEEYLREDEELQNVLQDFTYFSNADSLCRPTYPSLLNMVTGCVPDYDLSMKSATEKCWDNCDTKKSYCLTKEKGYEVNFFGSTYELGKESNVVGIFDNIEQISKEDISINPKVLFVNLAALGLYRVSPFSLKSIFWERAYFQDGVVFTTVSDSNTNTYDNAEFYKKLIEEKLCADENKKTITFQYLYGMHVPYLSVNMSEDGGVSKEKAMAGCMLILKEYISQLKQLDIYNNSSIIVAGDHGAEGASQQPVVLVKPSYRIQKEMIENSNPVSYAEFFPSIMYFAGVDVGDTFFDISEKPRIRTLTMRDYDSAFPKVRSATGTGYAKSNVWISYEYNGDRYDLAEKIEKNSYASEILMIDSK